MRRKDSTRVRPLDKGVCNALFTHHILPTTSDIAAIISQVELNSSNNMSYATPRQRRQTGRTSPLPTTARLPDEDVDEKLTKRRGEEESVWVWTKAWRWFHLYWSIWSVSTGYLSSRTNRYQRELQKREESELYRCWSDHLAGFYRQIPQDRISRPGRVSKASISPPMGLLALIYWDKITHISFDEVHFGSFAGQYIRREYYFDVHPPLAKMLNGLAGYFAGFNGDFNFDAIGDSYTVNNVGLFISIYTGGGIRKLIWSNGWNCRQQVPYIKMRAFCAFMGSITIPVVYAIMRESGYPVLIAAFSASLVLFGESSIKY